MLCVIYTLWPLLSDKKEPCYHHFLPLVLENTTWIRSTLHAIPITGWRWGADLGNRFSGVCLGSHPGGLEDPDANTRLKSQYREEGLWELKEAGLLLLWLPGRTPCHSAPPGWPDAAALRSAPCGTRSWSSRTVPRCLSPGCFCHPCGTWGLWSPAAEKQHEVPLTCCESWSDCYKPARNAWPRHCRNVLTKWRYPVPLHYWNFLQNGLIWCPRVKKRLGLQNFPCQGEVNASMGLTWRARSSWLQRSIRAMSKRRLMAREVISGRCSV